MKGTTKPTGNLKRFADAAKYDSGLLADIQRYLLTAPQNVGRDMTVLHASEMCLKHFCERAAYYRLTGEEGLAEEAAHFQLEAIWEAGNEIHRKWQGWINAIGRLRGQWRCVWCKHRWEATSPACCPACGCGEPVYMEVALWSEEYGLAGHADGDIAEGTDDDPLLEVKSIGMGTLRVEAPSLLARYTHAVELENGAERKHIDLDRLWRDIKQPLPSHMKQGMLYLHLSGRSRMHFIYEFKPTQAVKLFTVKYRKAFISDLLDLALDIKYAVAKGRLPMRPSWAESATSTGCKTCIYRVKCHGTQGEQVESEDEPQQEAPRRVPRRQVSGREAGNGAAREAEVLDTRGADEDHGDGRPGSDEPVCAPHSLAGLFGRAAGAGGGRRAVRRRPPDET